jgi:hypothetical protein
MSDIDQEIAGLEALSSGDLRAHWRKLTQSPLPRVSPKLLRLALAWEIQAQRLGGHSRATTRRLDQIARGETRTGATRPGMRLVREWQGRMHVVTIDEDQGIHHEGRTYRSLSEVARAITGTRWSGPAFFGLKRKVAA